VAGTDQDGHLLLALLLLSPCHLSCYFAAETALLLSIGACAVLSLGCLAEPLHSGLSQLAHTTQQPAPASLQGAGNW
jgi:hypothetical protein